VSTALQLRALRIAEIAANVTAIYAQGHSRCEASGCCNRLSPERGRSDRRYCSNACRQRAYRKRNAGSDEAR
jgi:hypothetical protein